MEALNKPADPGSLAKAFDACRHKVWMKMKT